MRVEYVVGALSTLMLVGGHAGAEAVDRSAELGTVEVDGSAAAAGVAPLPKLAVVPLVPENAEDSLAEVLVRRDLDLSGQFQVITDAPPGPWRRDTPIDPGVWRATGAETVVRVFAERGSSADRVTLHGEVFLVPRDAGPKRAEEGAAAPVGAKAAFATTVQAPGGNARAASHVLVDRLLGALTGRSGGFASRLAFASRVGVWQRVFVMDADGFGMHASSPDGATALSPSFAATGDVYYALSSNYLPYRLATGVQGSFFPFDAPGSMLGLSFAPDGRALAFALYEHGKGQIVVADAVSRSLRVISSVSLPSHPALGPLGRVAYVAGDGARRIYVDGSPVSPAGAYASSPTLCDTQEGLLVVFTLGLGRNASLYATDTKGRGLRRLTASLAPTSDAACSPDGRLVAFFSGVRGGRGPGLYMLPLARPWLAKKLADVQGEGLAWSASSTEP